MTLPPSIPRSPPHVPQALPYQPLAAQAVRDNEHLRYLSIGHYVYGGLMMLCSSLFIGHVVLGIMTIRNPSMFAPPVPTTGPGAAAAVVPPPVPPPIFGWMFVGMGGGAVLLGWTLAICTIVSGRCIARRRARMFSLIMAGINCVNTPFGTALGVLTFIVLLRDSVRLAYEGAAPPAPYAAFPR
jgi:hypothetical protein